MAKSWLRSFRTFYIWTVNPNQDYIIYCKEHIVLTAPNCKDFLGRDITGYSDMRLSVYPGIQLCRYKIPGYTSQPAGQ
jgi:hypothetical protein